MSVFDSNDSFNWLCSVYDPAQRNEALLNLGKNRQQFEDLGPVIWNSPGQVTILLQEIISLYPYLTGNSSNLILTPDLSNRVCNVLVLFQCIALHPDTRMELINAQIPSYLFPFLQCAPPSSLTHGSKLTLSASILKSREFEYLKLTSLGVFGSLVKSDSFEVIKFLLSTEIVPQCLKIMEVSSELSKTVALFIFMRIILNENGLKYICLNEVRLVSVINVLNSMISNIHANNSEHGKNGNNSNDNNSHPGRILKNLLRCYLRLCDEVSVRPTVKEKIPASLVIAVDPHQVVLQEYAQLHDNVNAIRDIISEDATVSKLLKQLLEALGLP
ncbi:hypothetical protein QEN19_004026 [Hanseniaspora menglaensis]